MNANCNGLAGLIFGHNFSARYSKQPAGNFKVRGDSYDFQEAITSMMKVTYVADVCTRCGKIVNMDVDQSEATQ